jgi:hypothetical protein
MRMMGRSGRQIQGLIVAIAVAAAAASCTKGGDPVPVPTPIAQPTITEHYSGTLSPAGSNLHFFQVTEPSEVHVTLTSLTAVAVDGDATVDPPIVAQPATPLTIPLTITVGQQALTTLGVQCSSLKSVVKPAGSTAQLTGQALAGTYCVSITDTNIELPRNATYAITVAHS